MPGDLLIENVMVLDPALPLGVVDIEVVNGVIAEVGPGLAARRPSGVIDGTGMIATPGLINAHTHSGQNLDRGVAPNLPLDLWLIWVVYGGIPFSPDDSYTLAMAGAVEMLESGCTAVLDQAWLSPDAFAEHAEAVMAAYADAGIRAGLAPMVQDRDIFESMSFESVGTGAPAPFSSALDPAVVTGWMRSFLDRWQGAHPLLTPMVGPSAPQRCSDELMASLADLARSSGALFHTHVLETRTQIVATRERYGGRSVVAVLDELGLLTSNTSLAHCVWMDAGEYAAVRDAGATIVHNPISNLRCGSGLLPLGDLLHGGLHVALGADGAASNDNQNMFEAMKFATLIHTLYGSHRQWPTALDVWSMCLRGGARALGQRLGSLEPGARADIVLLDSERHVAVHKESLAASLVLAEHGSSVRTVVVDGEIVVDDGVHCRGDRAATARRSRALQQRIHEALPERQAVYERHVEVLTAVHDHAMAQPVPIERLAAITPAFGPDPAR
jgi:5-methylthioadenosine/S-adenosylhomocysteine deaminase